ncbi:MAG TPA: carboxypeptidase-like regulatory domain-containing protein [Dongiaceae bacterium]|nr:carboxypeptidase-like regulatory domain-containing protein [Dongiaceae bacterium]
MTKRGATIRATLGFVVCGSILLAHAQTKPSAASSVPTRYRVSGVVVSKTDGHPLDRAHVFLADTNNRREPRVVIASEDGRFVFDDVRAGKYSLEGIKRGFISAAYEQHDQFSTAIVTGAGLDTENLILKLSPEAIISGRILDEAGEPVRHAAVTLHRDDHSQGVDQVYAFRRATTDDLGAYELTSVTPGTYFLSVTAQPWYAVHPLSASEPAGPDGRGNPEVDRSLDVTYPVTYYQNATESDDATPIEIRGGERVQIEMNLNPVPALRLIFHETIKGTGLFAPPQLERSDFDGSTYIQGIAQSLSSGTMELTGIPAGRYNIRIPGQNSVTMLKGVELTKDGEIDTSAAEAVGTVKISVTAPGEAALPQDLVVTLIPMVRNFYRGAQRLGAKGEVELRDVVAGTYDVRVMGGAKPYVVTALSAEGAQVKGHSITVPAGASATLALTVARGVDVQGVAKKAGKPFAQAMVVLVPKELEGNRDLFRRDQSDLDGTFSLHGVVPGSYTLVAIEDGWNMDWAQPEIIAAYVKRGRAVEVPGGTSGSMQVKDPVEVQAR